MVVFFWDVNKSHVEFTVSRNIFLVTIIVFAILLIFAPTLGAFKRCSQTFFLLHKCMVQLICILRYSHLVSECDNFINKGLLLVCERVHSCFQRLGVQVSNQLSILYLSSFFVCWVLSVHAIKIFLQLLHLLLAFEVHAPACAFSTSVNSLLHHLAGLSQLRTLE